MQTPGSGRYGLDHDGVIFRLPILPGAVVPEENRETGSWLLPEGFEGWDSVRHLSCMGLRPDWMRKPPYKSWHGPPTPLDLCSLAFILASVPNVVDLRLYAVELVRCPRDDPEHVCAHEVIFPAVVQFVAHLVAVKPSSSVDLGTFVAHFPNVTRFAVREYYSQTRNARGFIGPVIPPTILQRPLDVFFVAFAHTFAGVPREEQAEWLFDRLPKRRRAGHMCLSCLQPACFDVARRFVLEEASTLHNIELRFLPQAHGESIIRDDLMPSTDLGPSAYDGQCWSELPLGACLGLKSAQIGMTLAAGPGVRWLGGRLVPINPEDVWPAFVIECNLLAAALQALPLGLSVVGLALDVDEELFDSTVIQTHQLDRVDWQEVADDLVAKRVGKVIVAAPLPLVEFFARRLLTLLNRGILEMGALPSPRMLHANVM